MLVFLEEGNLDSVVGSHESGLLRQKYLRIYKDNLQMLIRVTTVEVCDATGDDSSNAAGIKIKNSNTHQI